MLLTLISQREQAFLKIQLARWEENVVSVL